MKFTCIKILTFILLPFIVLSFILFEKESPLRKNDFSNSHIKDETSFTLDQSQLKEWNITNGSITFTILKKPTSDKFGQVSLTSTSDKLVFQAVNLKVPDYVNYMGETYEITEMSDFIFADCKLISGTLSIGQNLLHISKGAFGGTMISGNIIIPPNVKSIDALAFNGLDLVGNYYLTSTNVVNFSKDAFLPFGTKFSKLHVPPSLVKFYKQNINLLDYAILPFEATENDQFLVTRDSQISDGIVYLGNSSKVTNFESMYHFSHNDGVNPALQIKLIPQNASYLQTRWISLTQPDANGNIGFYINPYYYTLYPNMYAFIIVFMAMDDSQIYVTDTITFSFLSNDPENIFTANYIDLYFNEILARKDFATEIDIVNDRKTNNILHFTPLAIRFNQLVWPIQKNYLSFKIDSNLIQNVTFVSDANFWIIDNSVKNGVYKNSVSINWNNQIVNEYFFNITIHQPSSELDRILLLSILPTILLSLCLITFLAIKRTNNKHKSK